MKKMLFLLLLPLYCFGQEKGQVENLTTQIQFLKNENQDMKLAMNTAGLQLQQYYRYQTGSIIFTVVGAGITTIGAFTDSKAGYIAGCGVIAVGFVMAIISHGKINNAGIYLTGNKRKR